MAQDIQLCGKLEQGELIYGTAANAIKVKFNSEEFDVNSKGEFLIAISRDEQKKSILEVFYNDNKSEKYDLQIKDHAWDIQSIKGVAQNKVTPSKADETEILRERTDVKNAFALSDNLAQSWKNGFILPLKGRISGHFGNQRIFNDVPKNPHNGTDIAAPNGTKVLAAGDGKILLAGGNYFYSGNMVIIDHGQGLQTIYAHLSKVLVKVGDVVKKEDIIGLVGATGRATGPHLHWGATVNNVRFRPHSLLEDGFKKCVILRERI
jgi:murein DD-endopeptidase MepM/ murein hydrolase activator NlpD